jgi:hypothetical protein
MLAAFALPVIPALPVAAAPLLPAAVPSPDPIFALIEAHICAYEDFIHVLDDLAVAEQTAWHAPRGKRRAAKAALKQAYAAERRFGNLEAGALERLVATSPQTLHGAAAALRYVRERFEQGHETEEAIYVTLVRSIERAICQAAGLPCPARDAA